MSLTPTSPPRLVRDHVNAQDSKTNRGLLIVKR